MVRGSLRPVLTTGGHSGLRAALNLGRRPEPSMQPLSAFLGCALRRLGQDAREQPRALLAAQEQQARTCDQALGVQYPRRRITGEITRDRNASSLPKEYDPHGDDVSWLDEPTRTMA